MSARRTTLGGVVHTYQKYDPGKFPSPTAPPPDLVSHAFEHALMYGGYRELTEEELARALARLTAEATESRTRIAALEEDIEHSRGKLDLPGPLSAEALKEPFALILHDEECPRQPGFVWRH